MTDEPTAEEGGIAPRAYRPEDRPAVRRICGDTGFFGRPLEEVLHERELMVDGLLDYYTECEPGSLFVAEEGGAVKGYLSGCVDTLRAIRIAAARVTPKLLLGFFLRGHAFRPRSWRMLGAGLILGGRRSRALAPILRPFPAHFHINLDPDLRRRGVGSRLVSMFLDRLRESGVRGVHGCVATEGGMALCRRFGFRTLASFPLPRCPRPAPPRTFILGREL